MDTLSTPFALPDFDVVDRLPSQAAGEGRLVIGARGAPARPSLLFVPGAFHGAWCYAAYLQYFAAHGIGCAALDLPGHGWLPQTPEFHRYGVRDYGRCVAQAMDLIEGPVIVAGHSMGALPVLYAATVREVAAVVLMAPSPPRNVPGARALPPVPPDASRPPPGLEAIRRRFTGEMTRDEVAAVAIRLCPESAEAMNDRYLLRLEIPPHAVNAPGLCLEAGDDDAERHPPGQDKAVADLYGFEYRLLPSLPHCMMYARGWEESAAAIHGWYRRSFPD
ncbi:alpha/beta hydrolase [Bordetella bronchialis]|uniref:Alpha/beta hydrolase n=1 Tax=Bordetella bronchialis TaxID=463025 RepID=A0ABN4R688_9BORD|nr:alpha/beta hydrolase family protein [Bordetella bronchialis]ANN68717.1 alpha/beta hydrolase [Bordetella bronchialis]